MLMVDNVLVSHGRMPYAGNRRVLVSMTRAAWEDWLPLGW